MHFDSDNIDLQTGSFFLVVFFSFVYSLFLVCDPSRSTRDIRVRACCVWFFFFGIRPSSSTEELKPDFAHFSIVKKKLKWTHLRFPKKSTGRKEADNSQHQSRFQCTVLLTDPVNHRDSFQYTNTLFVVASHNFYDKKLRHLCDAGFWFGLVEHFLSCLNQTCKKTWKDLKVNLLWKLSAQKIFLVSKTPFSRTWQESCPFR